MPSLDQPVTIERLERGLFVLAFCMELDGPVHAPLYEKLETELARLRQNNDTITRAKLRMQSYIARDGMKAIC
jgi:hypothetical protein